MKEIPLTPDQLAAVDVGRRHLDACVTAGPGSGKTTVLVEYFRRLVESGVDPLRILAITFTEKAAGNMRAKLAEAFHQDAAMRARLERAWVSTVHGFCGRLLREYAVPAGIDPEFYVADQRESRRLQLESLAAAVNALFGERPAEMRALVRGLASPEFDDAALSAYDAMRGAGVGVEALGDFRVPPGPSLREAALTLEELQAAPLDGWSAAQRQNLDAALEGAERAFSAASPLDALRAIEEFVPNLRGAKKGTAAYVLLKRLRDELTDARYALVTAHYAPERALLIELFRRFDAGYRERKRQAGALDFADLEEFAARLLAKNAGARARIREQFDHVLMDEFQDTNGQQAKLIELLRRPGNFYAVGDVNQSIFGFRHAEPGVFRAYRDSAAARGHRLVELAGNFRSRSEVLLAVETVFDGAEGVEPRKLTAERQFGAGEDGEACVECFTAVAEDAASALEIEARWVAKRALELETPFRDIAVLVRNTEVIPAFTAAFDGAGIPYVVNRGRGFYDCREAADMANLLRVIANPRDETALAAVLRSPLADVPGASLPRGGGAAPFEASGPAPRGVSDEGLLQLRLLGENMGASLAAVAAHEAEFDPEDCRRLRAFAGRLKEWRARREYVTFDRLLLEAIDESGYEPESGARGAANLDKFLAMARDAAARVSLDEFVEQLAALRESDPREPDAPPEESAEAVTIMTAHSAKGLEFSVVFVAAMHKGVQGEPAPVAFSPAIGLAARWRNPACRRGDKSDLYHRALRLERAKAEREEAERLLYVAMTRAERRLILSFSMTAKAPANWAALVTERLELEQDRPRDEVVTRTAPGGEEWKLRVVVADCAPDLVSAKTKADPKPGEARPRVAPHAASVCFGSNAASSPQGQQDGNAGVTALVAFTRCPRAYYLGGYLGFQGAARRGGASRLPAAELGIQTHALLAGAAVPDPDPEAARLAGNFRQSALGRRLERATRVEREYDFELAIEDLVVGGSVDLWFEEGGELVLVDYKTDGVTRAQAHERAAEYALQLRIYAMAVERAAGRPVDRAWACFLRPNTAVEIDLAPSLLDAPEQAVREFQRAQNSLDFPMNPGERCRGCQFQGDLCPAVV
jgi:ATP-dependent helicase/nuclease subunit A